MDEETIDLIYQNEEVEGVAIFTTAGELVDNQLSITEDSLYLVSTTVSNIAASLASADRRLKGFLLQSDKITLQICVFQKMILILQLSAPFCANSVDKKVRSLFTSGTSAVPIASPTFSPNDDPQPFPSGSLPEPEPQLILDPQPLPSSKPIPVPAQANKSNIELEGFIAELSKLLNKVVPEKVADGMINNTLITNNVSLDSKEITKEEAIKIGQLAIDKIPNKARRRMITSEFQELSKGL